MDDSQIQHDSVLLPGYWRITAFGRLAENPRSTSQDLRIRTYLAPLTNGSDATVTGRIAGPIKTMLLPIGEIPRLYLNAILHDGKLATHRSHRLSHEQIADRTLDCARQNVSFIGRFKRDDDGDFVIPAHDKWTGLRDDPELHGLFVAIGSPNDPYATVIPAVEVFRFFYATSDVLAKGLLHDHFLDPGTHVWNPDKTVLLADGSAVLWLRKRMLDADACFLARFAFDEFALTQAQRIFLYSSAAGRTGGERVLWAAPPFEASVRVKAVCWPIGGPDGQRILVTRLLQCDWKPPWKRLSWDRDNDGRYDPKNRPERDPVAYSPGLLTIPSDDEQEPAKLADVPPSGANVPSRLKEQEISERFPELAKTPADKLPQENAETRANKKDWRPLVAEAYPGSVIEGKSAMELVGRAIIAGLDQMPERRPEATDEVDVNVGQEDYLSILRLLQAINALSLAQVEFIVVLDTSTTQHGVEFNVFPAAVDGKRRKWLYVGDLERNRRMALVASVQCEGRWRYVIELQQKRVGECSTMITWEIEERQLSSARLGYLLMDCAREGRAALVSASHLQVEWGRLRHTTKGTDAHMARHYLQRIMTVIPESASAPAV